MEHLDIVEPFDVKSLIENPPSLSKEDHIHKLQRQLVTLAKRQTIIIESVLKRESKLSAAEHQEIIDSNHSHYKILKRQLESLKKSQ